MDQNYLASKLTIDDKSRLVEGALLGRDSIVIDLSHKVRQVIVRVLPNHEEEFQTRKENFQRETKATLIVDSSRVIGEEPEGC